MFPRLEAVAGRTWPGSRQVYAKGGAYTKITTSKTGNQWPEKSR